MRLIKKILFVIVGVNNNYQGGTRGGEKLMKKARILFAAIKVKVEVVTKEMTERTAIRCFIYVGVAIVTPYLIGE